MVHACNPSTQEDNKINTILKLHGESESSLGYKRPCHKKLQLDQWLELRAFDWESIWTEVASFED